MLSFMVWLSPCSYTHTLCGETDRQQRVREMMTAGLVAVLCMKSFTSKNTRVTAEVKQKIKSSSI